MSCNAATDPFLVFLTWCKKSE